MTTPEEPTAGIAAARATIEATGERVFALRSPEVKAAMTMRSLEDNILAALDDSDTYESIPIRAVNGNVRTVDSPDEPVSYPVVVLPAGKAFSGTGNLVDQCQVTLIMPDVVLTREGKNIQQVCNEFDAWLQTVPDCYPQESDTAFDTNPVTYNVQCEGV